MLMFKITIVLMVLKTLKAAYIPEDVEVLDGYDLDHSLEYYPQDTYSEADSHTGLIKAIRNKRSLIAEHNTQGAELDVNRFNSPVENQTNSYENADLEEMHPPNKSNESIFDRIRRSENSPSSNPDLLAMTAKQTNEENFYKKGMWNIHSFDTDYNTKRYDDLLVESTNNEGIKGRTPRVHFITQQNKNSNIDKGTGILPKITSIKSRLQEVDNNPNDIYPSRSYEPYLRRYDRYDDQHNRYDPYYEDYYLYRRRYDPYDSYSPRSPTYPDAYYHYPDRRYDMPEPRDYRPLYTNEINDRLPPFQPTRNNNNGQRRIIYYAHLPEIVHKSPPNIDLTYQRYDPNRYEDQNYIGPVSGAYKHGNKNLRYSRDQYEVEFENQRKNRRNIQTYSI